MELHPRPAADQLGLFRCGFKMMRHDVPRPSTALAKWRRCGRAKELTELSQKTVALVLLEKQVTPKELE